MTIIICTVLLCVTYFITNIVRTRSIEREHEAYRKHEIQLYRLSNDDNPSPYILKRELSQSTKNWGYSIFDTRTNKFVSSNGYYEVFVQIEDALHVMNNLEVFEKFTITEL